MEKLKCTSCNGDLELDEKGKFATCKFCGTKYKLDGDKIIVVNIGDVSNNLSKLSPKIMTPFIVIFSSISVFVVSIILLISSNIYNDVDKYNLEFKYGEGTQNGVFVQETLNKVTSKNKTNDHKITVKYNGEESLDEDTIINIKHSLKSLVDYEVKYEYDSKGYISKIIIEDIK